MCGKRKGTKTSVRASMKSLARAPQRHRVARRPTPEARRMAHVRALTNPNAHAHAHAARATPRRPLDDRTRAMQHISTHPRARIHAPRPRARATATSRRRAQHRANPRARHPRSRAPPPRPRPSRIAARPDARRTRRRDEYQHHRAKRTSSAHVPIVSRSRGLKRRNEGRRDATSSVSGGPRVFITLYPGAITTQSVPPRCPVGFTILVLYIRRRPCITHTNTRTICSCNTPWARHTHRTKTPVRLHTYSAMRSTVL